MGARVRHRQSPSNLPEALIEIAALLDGREVASGDGTDDAVAWEVCSGMSPDQEQGPPLISGGRRGCREQCECVVRDVLNQGGQVNAPSEIDDLSLRAVCPRR
jgi:hypothetical protein